MFYTRLICVQSSNIIENEFLFTHLIVWKCATLNFIHIHLTLTDWTGSCGGGDIQTTGKCKSEKKSCWMSIFRLFSFSLALKLFCLHESRGIWSLKEIKTSREVGEKNLKNLWTVYKSRMWCEKPAELWDDVNTELRSRGVNVYVFHHRREDETMADTCRLNKCENSIHCVRMSVRCKKNQIDFQRFFFVKQQMSAKCCRKIDFSDHMQIEPMERQIKFS